MWSEQGAAALADTEYTLSRHTAREKTEFYGHMAVYAVAMLVMFVLNLLIAPDFYWFLFPAGGWGIAILFHFVSVFFAEEEPPANVGQR